MRDGLIDTEFARLSGRTGPGAGRPSKLYRRSGDDIAVSLPERENQFAAALMADAISDSARTGAPVMESLARMAATHGRALGIAAGSAGAPAGAAALDVVCEVLAEHGFEPRVDAGQAVLANCPFHALATTHTALVCGMNLALIDAMVDEVEPGAVECRLDPSPGRCCVTLSALPER
ncbi:transcriptional regulator [Aeromicrobium sp. A1-2]|uniref:transcriptional regulator n=1 Tax=Aeromicrobium sp. A1-2 TaxID=2107713 RepID=UPI000E47B808|nr:transcriptional regulator [Aeromicrobium sp. A1-2]AXT86147.1 transcriptional regulator [Aeromicrobium sp. A1-2]